MQIKDTKEAVGFENGHMTLTLALTASVDSAEVQTLLAARHVDINMQERLKRLEAQLEAMQRQQGGQSTEQTSAAPPNDISEEELQALRMQAAQGDAKAQTSLGFLYYNGKGIPQDYEKAREWLEIAAAQGYAAAQGVFGVLYMKGHGVPRDNVRAYMWFNLAALHLTGRPQEASAELRNRVSRMMTTTQIAEAQRLAQQCEARQFKGC
ncbi:MAG: sel1 repeat family protein [Nitrospira sp.]|nr:MAG: sel1 repeat family protein [Nitrospira sp.]